MTVSSTEGTSALWNTTASSSTSSSSSSDQDMFLQLLVAQLKYQDPMNPTDSTQFLSQNAQFQQLTQLQDLSDQIDNLLNAQMTFGAAGMIGKEVTYADVNGNTYTGTATGTNFSSSGPTLIIDGTTVPISMVVSVNNASSGSTGSTTTDTTTTDTDTAADAS